MRTAVLLPIGLLLLISLLSCTQNQERVPSKKLSDTNLSLWNNTPQKERILSFVDQVLDNTASTYLAPKDRVAVFDFDGTIGCEKPEYMEVVVAMEQLCQLAQKDTTLLKDSLYLASCEHNYEYINAHVYQAILTAFDGYDQDVYIDSVIQTTSFDLHPRFNIPYNQMYYAPMLELMNYLKGNDFEVYIVSGSQEGFLRAYGGDYLQVDNENIIGSSIALNYELESDNTSLFIRENKYLSPKADGSGKAELIRNIIGKQPVLAFGNTMGDYEMLAYSSSHPTAYLELILIHDDEREYIYHDTTLEGMANKNNWVPVRMKENFKIIFPFEED